MVCLPFVGQGSLAWRAKFALRGEVRQVGEWWLLESHILSLGNLRLAARRGVHEEGRDERLFFVALNCGAKSHNGHVPDRTLHGLSVAVADSPLSN